MKKLIIISVAIIFAGIGCTDLEEELYDQIPADEYPENESQVATLGVDAYNALTELIDDQGWWFLAQELTSDEFCGPTRDADWWDGGKWVVMHRHTWNNDVEGVNRMWDKMWTGVTKSNQTLDLLRELDQNEAVMKKMAELEVLRSFYYYLLIDNYGDIPYLTSAKDAPENPYKITREAVFDSLTTTVEEKLSHLDPVDNKYLVTRYMAYGLLAKLYLNAEVYTGTPQWDKAEMYTDSVLAGPYSLSGDVLSPFVTDNQNSSEIIFSIAFDEDLSQGFRLHMRTMHYQHNLKFNSETGPWNGLAITPNHWNRYSENDVRKEAYNMYGWQLTPEGDTIIDGETEEKLYIYPELPALVMKADDGYSPDEYRNTGARVAKYEIKMGYKENLSNDFPLFRLTDFYLMKAECRIRIAGAGSGDQWITPVRERAGISSASGFGLDSLLMERGKELYVEGHRRQDLIRFGKFTEPWWEKGGQYEGNANDPDRKTFPIPKWATEANPNLLEDPQ